MTPWTRKEVIGDCQVTFAGDERQVTVYCVRAGQGSDPVYVGSTTQLLKHRIRGHVLDTQNGSELPFHAWLRERQAFLVEVLERVPESGRVAAEQKWVSRYSGLLNVTNGGPGLSGHRFAGSGHAAKIAEKLRQGSNCSCEVCGSAFWRKPRDMKVGHSRFCSRGCYQAWQRGRPKSNASGLMGVAGRAAALVKRRAAQ